MIRQASSFGRLLVSVRGKETVVIRGIIPPVLGSRLSTIDNKFLPCVITSRTFSVTKKLKEENKVEPLKISQELESVLAKNSTEDVLNAAVSLKLHPQSVRLVLKRLTDLKDDPKGFALDTDGRFIQLMGYLDTGVSDLSPYSLVDSLFYLLQLTREDHDTIKRLEARAKEMLLRLKFSQLLRVVQMHKTSNQTSLRRAVHEDAMTILEMRWAEITNPKDLVSVLYIAPSDRVKWLSNLEQKTLELSETINAKELYRILYLMAKRNRRNVPVIRSLVYHMNRLTLDLSPIQLANLSYACAKLNIYDASIMGKIVEGVLSSEGDQASVDELSTVVRSSGMLQWCDSKLMDGVAERFLTRGSVVPLAGWVALLLTAGSVNYLPPNVVERLSDIVSKVEALRESDPRSWLDVVWSLIILSRATTSMVSSVLSQDFLSSVKGADASKNPNAAYMKLMNINAVARFNLSGYSGPFLSNSLLEEFVKQLPIHGRSSLTDCLLDTLSNMASLDKYVRTNVKTLAGFVLDAELIVQKTTGELKPFGDKGSTFGSSSLPENLNKVAIKLLEFGDMTHGTSVHPTGLNVLRTQCLTAAGYKIVQIPCAEFNTKMTTVQRVQYLNTKIKEALGLALPSSQSSAVSLEVAKSSPSSPAVKENTKIKEAVGLALPSSQSSAVVAKPSPISPAVKENTKIKEAVSLALPSSQSSAVSLEVAKSSPSSPAVKENTKIKEAVGLALPSSQSSAVVAKLSPSSPAVKGAIKKEKQSTIDTISASAAKPESKNPFVRPSIKDILDVDSSLEGIKMAEKPLKKVNLKATGGTKELKGKNASSKSNSKAKKSQNSVSESTAESQSQGTTALNVSKQE